MANGPNADTGRQVVRATWIQTAIALAVLLGSLVLVYASLRSDVAVIERRLDDGDLVRTLMQKQLDRIEQRIIDGAR